MDLIVVRHARPLAETRLENEGPADPPLSPVGLEQAETTANFLADWGITHIVSSSMLRAFQTAKPLSEKLGVEIEVIDDLKEADHKRSSYTPVEEMDPDDPLVKQYIENPESFFDGGLEAFRERTVNAFNKIIKSNKSGLVAVFCHGMVMSVYLQTLIEHADPLALHPDYCGLMRITAHSSGLRSVRSVNEHTHVRHLLD